MTVMCVIGVSAAADSGQYDSDEQNDSTDDDECDGPVFQRLHDSSTAARAPTIASLTGVIGTGEAIAYMM